ncbi:hypothetical protein [Mycoplasma sp. P36-A1]|uniref:hypothetical protein n=1 Tax=Mycoplasma sp. P36-A1 TaxID=3252900 RepID=UPI003C2EDC51
MNIYTKVINQKVKVAYTFAKVFFVLAIASAIINGLVHFQIIRTFQPYKTFDIYITIVLLVLAILTLVIAKATDKRDNILYDGTNIKFRTNKKINEEYKLKDIEQMVPIRKDLGIAYGMCNALAFRMSKDSNWILITSEYYRKGRKIKDAKTSIELIKTILSDYSTIKTQRAIKEIDDQKGVIFSYLIIKDKSMNDIDVRNAYLKKFEAQILNSNPHSDNTKYGDFLPNKLVLTKDSLYINKTLVATIKESDYVEIRTKFKRASEDYYTYDIIDFYDKNSRLIISIDLALVINSEFFKSMVKSIFYIDNKASL